MEIKRALLNKVQRHRRSDSIITSNTSGLPIHEDRRRHMPMELRRHWFGTHFFNPPRYMRLLEIIATTGHRSGRYGCGLNTSATCA